MVSDTYVRSSERLDMICEEGHTCSISWDNFKFGRRCKECASNLKANMFKLKYQDVKEYIESKNCSLLSKEYKNNRTKLTIKCSCGEVFERNLSKFKESQKCPKCSKKSTRKHDYDYIKECIERFNYKLLSREYNGADKYILVQCGQGHKPYKVKFSNFHSGRRCPHCSENYTPTIEEVKAFLSDIGYTCLNNEYKNSRVKLDLICDKGHTIKMTLRDIKSGCRCATCNTSKGEKRIQEYLKKNNLQYVYDQPYFQNLVSDKGNPLRPDFIIEKEKIWIEYDGEFHYKDITGNLKTQQYHDKLKDEYAKKHGWKLIRIPYWEFDNIENILNKEIFNKK